MSIALSMPLSTLFLAAAAVIAVSGCGVSVAFGDDGTERVETETVAVADLSVIRDGGDQLSPIAELESAAATNPACADDMADPFTVDA